MNASSPCSLSYASLRDEPPQDQLDWLSEDERARASRFVLERDRRRYLAAHVALRKVLATQLGSDPARLAFETGPFGKPRLRGSRLRFSLSHSEDLAAIAVTQDTEVGVDVEMLREVDRTLAVQVCTADEQRQIDAEPAHHARAFLTCWTRKEACLKALGWGLNVEPATITVGARADTANVEIRGDRRLFRVTLQSMPAPARAVVAVARCIDQSHGSVPMPPVCPA
ncbi:MAG: 4'-phosphopantetheinyl transferase [Burkholderiaceae bacterium]|jgi:4'-phosphopantetheinyl transferase|nr:MAG: 4'-phosphopantetheinyl transferase [Burkholderiaceae bacterium]